MLKDEIATVLSLASLLGKRVIGQAHALDMVAQRVQTSRAALDDPIKPVGVFMLVGPSGVGENRDGPSAFRSALWRRTQSYYY